MTIKKAYDLGLLTVGRIIKTNGNDGLALLSKKVIIGKIVRIAKTFISINISTESPAHPGITDWRISTDNNYAFIEFVDIEMSIKVLSHITNKIVKCQYNEDIVYLKSKNASTYQVGLTYTIICITNINNTYLEIIIQED